MKVERPHDLRPPEPPKKPFGEVLRKQKPTPGAVSTSALPSRHAATKPPLTAHAHATKSPSVQVARATPSAQPPVNAPAQQLARARVQVDGEAQRLGVVRSDHSHAASAMTQARTERGEQLDEKQTAKLMDALTQEFSKEAPPPPPAPVVKLDAMQAGAPAKTDAAPENKAAQATALIEKIEHFVRSNRPGLSLTLNNSLGARVELERLGPKELSVKLFGKPGAEAVSRIREELRARGLNVKLTVV